MKTKTGASKVNISMPKELYDYLKKMVDDHNAKPENAHCPTDFSKMVQKAIRGIMQEDRKPKKCEPGKASSPGYVGAKILKASESSASSHSTHGKNPSRKTG